VGRHRGLWFHTIGQRKGLGLMLDNGHSNRGPWIVHSKNLTSNELYITNKYTLADDAASTDADAVAVVEPKYSMFTVGDVNWNGGQCPVSLSNPPFTLRVRRLLTVVMFKAVIIVDGKQAGTKVRHGPRIHECTIKALSASGIGRTVHPSGSTEYEVALDGRDVGISAGQYAGKGLLTSASCTDAVTDV
jgi:hypothetical protein